MVENLKLIILLHFLHLIVIMHMNFFSAYNMNIKTLLLIAKPQKQIIQICFKRNLLYPIRF